MQNITFTTSMGVNNLEYMKLLLHSLKTNLDNKEHQIIVFVDADNEGTLEYLLSVKKDFHDLCIINNIMGFPVGYQRNKTILTEYAKYDIISYLQSDMVIGPHYDTEILKHTKRGRILSSTRVEPPLHGQSPVTITKDFGLHPSEFDMENWNAFSASVTRNELISYFFAPITYYKEDWMNLDGYDTIFRRAREDSDLVQRCVHANIELVQTFSANVYHFTCVTSRGQNWFDKENVVAQQRVAMQQQADNIEVRRFLRKWGNFNHGEEKLFKLDTDLVVKNYDLGHVIGLEPFFHRVWLQTEEDRNKLLAEYNKLHIPANYLLSVTDEQWNAHKHLFHTENFDEIFRVGEPTEYSTKIIIDFSKVSIPNEFFNNIQNLYHMLHDYEPGDYELEGITITIRNMAVLPVSIQAKNPPFDHTLLTVY